jgi:cobalt-zinc-cadmium efflux system outer membrane protein
MKTTRRIAGIIACLLGLLTLDGCANAPGAATRDTVSTQLVKRIGLGLAPPPKPGQMYLPNGISLGGALVEDEAVLIALWNNAAFSELLADLGIARGDLIQAGLLPNPEFVYYPGVPERPFKYLFDLPIEAIWLRPIRKASALRESERVGERVTQAGLDLARDVRLAFADVLVARDKAKVAQDAVDLRGSIAKIAEVRLKEGDISEQEAAAARIDVLTATQALAKTRYDSELAEERLRNLMGTGCDRSPLFLWKYAAPLYVDLDVEALAADAICTRPDVRAAEDALAAAERRLCLSKVSWIRLLGIGDATSGPQDHTFGPAFRVTVPILSWNQGNIARFEAEAEKAANNRQTVRNQVLMDVHLAHTRYAQARAELSVLVGQVQPEVDKAITLTRRAYQEGNTPYVVVLETSRQFLDTRLREAELEAELRRSWAELERSVGHRLHAPVAPPFAPVGKTVPEKASEKEPEKKPEKTPEKTPEKMADKIPERLPELPRLPALGGDPPRPPEK